jgi:hypothetical protein
LPTQSSSSRHPFAAAFDEFYVRIMRRKTRMQDPQQPAQALSPITGALAVDVFGLALALSFLRAICSIPSFGIAKFAVNIWSPDINKNANKTDGCRELLRVFSMLREKLPKNKKSNQYCKLLLLLIFLVWCSWAGNALRFAAGIDRSQLPF